MERKLVFVYFVCMAFSNGLDVDRMLRRPPGMKPFDINRFLGTWYVTFATNPCSWNGANKFTNWYQHYTINKSTGNIVGYDIWRKGMLCATIPMSVKMTGPSCYKVQDSIGDFYTGTAVVVATDYKHFAITWGCSRLEDDGKTCKSSWISLKTRTPYPSSTVLNAADMIFEKLWGLSTFKVLKIDHGNPCKMDSKYSV